MKLVKDRNSNYLPSKQNKNRKIDGFAATLNSHTKVIDLLVKPQGTGNVGFISVRDMLNR